MLVLYWSSLFFSLLKTGTEGHSITNLSLAFDVPDCSTRTVYHSLLEYSTRGRVVELVGSLMAPICNSAPFLQFTVLGLYSAASLG
jgi:hypothetical protein